MESVIKNQNVDKLTQDTRDILQYVLDYGIGFGGLPISAIELKIDGAIDNLLNGGEGLHFHGLFVSDCYLKSRGNEEWAIIFPGQGIGDPVNGKKLLKKLLEG